MAALDRTFALAEVDRVAERIAQHLELHVPASADQLLQVQRSIAEGLVGFEAGLGERLLQRGLIVAAAHALAAAARGRLEQHRIAHLRGHAASLVRAGQRPVRSGNRRQPGACHRGLGARLVAHAADRVGRGTDEGDALLRASRGEQGVLREETVAGMDGLAGALFGGLQDRVRVEIGGFRAGGADADRLIGLVEPRRVTIGLGVRDHRPHTQRATGANDAQSDLAAIGDQHGSEHEDAPAQEGAV